MGLIRDLRPINTAEEREKFLHDASYNPQFMYVREFSHEEMTKYGQPNEQYYQHARSKLDKFGPPQDPQKPFCTPEQIIAEVNKLFNQLQIPALKILFKDHITSQVLIHSDGLVFRLPIKFNLESLRNKLNHEIQTHYLRKYNQSLQDWEGTNQQKYPTQFRATEEGLANLHSYVGREMPLMRKTYLNYFASYRASQASFRELYDDLISYGVREQLAWNLTLKQKRGLKDTSQPGGFPKNHLYFEGAVSVWNWLRDSSNDLRQLYQGRLSLNDAEKLATDSLNPRTVYPTFYKNHDEYFHFLEEIGKINQLENLPNIHQ